ncbi:MAG: undecaprenyl-diphosphate phosphatase [Actinomycetes bacterium]
MRIVGHPSHQHRPLVPARRRPLVAVLGGTAVAIAVILAMTAPAGAAAVAQRAAEAATGGLTWWKAAMLGVVEGVTEFLPISSTGHLLVTEHILNLDGGGYSKAADTYAIAIQFGAILAVAGLFWRRFVEMFDGLIGRFPAGRELLINVVIAFLPAAVIGFALDDTIKSALFGPWPVVAAWFVGGVAILVLDRRGLIPARGAPVASVRPPVFDITRQQALIIGLAQCLSLWPGTSRSLVTILGALLCGVGMVAAVEFSFLLGFVTLSAATAFSLLKDGGDLVSTFGVVTPLVGALFALISAVVAIRWMLTYLERHSLDIFGWYRIGVSVLTVGLILANVV